MCLLQEYDDWIQSLPSLGMVKDWGVKPITLVTDTVKTGEFNFLLIMNDAELTNNYFSCRMTFLGLHPKSVINGTSKAVSTVYSAGSSLVGRKSSNDGNKKTEDHDVDAINTNAEWIRRLKAFLWSEIPKKISKQ